MKALIIIRLCRTGKPEDPGGKTGHLHPAAVDQDGQEFQTGKPGGQLRNSRYAGYNAVFGKSQFHRGAPERVLADDHPGGKIDLKRFAQVVYPPQTDDICGQPATVVHVDVFEYNMVSGIEQ